MTESEGSRCSGADGDAPAEEAGVQVTERCGNCGNLLAHWWSQEIGCVLDRYQVHPESWCHKWTQRTEGPKDGPQSVT